LFLGPELAYCYAKLSARLQHFRARAQQGQILRISNINKVVEDRVMENAPPIAIFLRPGLQRFVPPFEPSVGHRGERRRKIGADGTSRQANEQCGGEPPAQPYDSAALARLPFGFVYFAPGERCAESEGRS
jgi:hypothetical protein